MKTLLGSPGVDELEDEAVGGACELYCGDWVVGLGILVGAPLDVEADDGELGEVWEELGEVWEELGGGDGVEGDEGLDKVVGGDCDEEGVECCGVPVGDGYGRERRH
ncbi:hypothetical protein AKJ16_DCAP22935 [Drosera capensis]